MGRRILQLGAGPLLTHSLRLIQAMGHQVYAVDRNPAAPGFALADGHRVVDLPDAEGIERYAREIGADLILAVNEAGVLAATEASEAIGLPALPRSVALAALDKGLMRDRWRTAGLPQPEYATAETPGEAEAAAARLGFPLVVKPALGWGSRGVSLAREPGDLAWSLEFASQEGRSGRCIVERFIDGTELTLEGLVRDGDVHVLATSDKEHQAHPRFRVAMGLNYPARVSPELLELALRRVREAAAALGLENGALHAEVMCQGGEVYLVEMGARPGGGHIFGQIVEAVSGVCMPRALVQILLGEPVDLAPRFTRGACYRFFQPPPGVFRGIDGIESARAEAGVLDVGFELEPGSRVGPVAGDADRPGFVVTTAATREEAMSLADRVVASMRYDMESGEPAHA